MRVGNYNFLSWAPMRTTSVKNLPFLSINFNLAQPVYVHDEWCNSPPRLPSSRSMSKTSYIGPVGGQITLERDRLLFSFPSKPLVLNRVSPLTSLLSHCLMWQRSTCSLNDLDLRTCSLENPKDKESHYRFWRSIYERFVENLCLFQVLKCLNCGW